MIAELFPIPGGSDGAIRYGANLNLHQKGEHETQAGPVTVTHPFGNSY